jgi:cell division inhibitor SepF
VTLLPSWWEKFLSFVGFADDSVEEEEEGDILQASEKSPRKQAPILSLHSSPDVKIVVVSPEGFEEVEKLAGHLKNRRPVIVNFRGTPKETAQRIIDFLSGAVFALNGSTCKVTPETFLFNPSNISVYSDDLSGDLRERLSLKWDQGGIRDLYQEKG